MTPLTSSWKQTRPKEIALGGEPNFPETQTLRFPSYFCDFNVESSKRVSLLWPLRARGNSPLIPKFHWVSGFVTIL